MYCRKCGRENPDDSVYCKSCGEKLNEEIKKTEVIENIPKVNYNQNRINETQTKNNDWTCCCGCLLIIFIVIAIASLMIP